MCVGVGALYSYSEFYPAMLKNKVEPDMIITGSKEMLFVKITNQPLCNDVKPKTSFIHWILRSGRFSGWLECSTRTLADARPNKISVPVVVSMRYV